MNITVTGGAGFMGSHLSRALAQHNRVTIYDNLSVGRREAVADILESGAARLIDGDILDAPLLEQSLAGADVVFHLAVLNLRACMTDPLAAEAVNVRGTLNTCLAAQAAGVRRFVYVSSSDIYGDVDRYPTPETCPPRPTTIYGAVKLAGEHIAMSLRAASNLPAMVVRPFNTYGPGEHMSGASGEVLPRFILYALAGRPLPVFGSGGQTRSFTHIEDTVRGLLAAGAVDELPDGPVNIASPDEVSVLDCAQKILRALNLPETQIEHLPARPGDVDRQAADTALAQSLFGFQARITLEQGLPELIDYVKFRNIDLDAAPRMWPRA